jgi:hypothetical protein
LDYNYRNCGVVKEQGRNTTHAFSVGHVCQGKFSISPFLFFLFGQRKKLYFSTKGNAAKLRQAYMTMDQKNCGKKETAES